MKDIIKNKWFWIIIILILLIIFFIFFKNINSGAGKEGISKEEFEQVELGMSQNDVAKIVSSDNMEPVNEEIEKSSENHIYKYVYKYYGEKKGYAIITYEADYSNGDIFVLPVVVQKEQIDLE